MCFPPLSCPLNIYFCRLSVVSSVFSDFKPGPGVYAAFSAGGGGGEGGARSFFGGRGVHFKLERTSCQQSLKYISLFCILRKVHPFLLKKDTSFCVIKIRNIIQSTTNW